MSTALLILLVLLIVGAFPAWPHSAGWGFGPASALLVLLIVLLIMLLTGRL
jgi:hypothetical protein